jgi:predicted metal-dependent TIM-barrel fold hydrolase
MVAVGKVGLNEILSLQEERDLFAKQLKVSGVFI